MPSIFHLFPTLDAEDTFLVKSWGNTPDRPIALLVPERERIPLLRSLVQHWEEAYGREARWWGGTLWEVPALRTLLQALQDKTQAVVLAELAAAEGELAASDGEGEDWLAGRDREALRCLQEMLAPEETILPVSTWRELAALCRSTGLEWGELPWQLTISTDTSVPAGVTAPLWLVRAAAPFWPEGERTGGSWLACRSEIMATAAKQDALGNPLRPFDVWAAEQGWAVQSIPSALPAVSENPVTRQTFHRAEKWKEFCRQRIFSVTELERFAESPFGYFAERVLRLEPVRPEVRELEPHEIGLLVHRVLEHLFRERPLKRGEDRPLLQELLAEEIARYRQKRPALEPLLIARQQERIERALFAVTGEATPLQPTYFEWGFGDGTVPPLAIDFPGGDPIRLRGRVDRIDIDPKRKTFLVIDYKTGSRRVTSQALACGNALQLPLYIEAVRQLLLPNYTPVGGMIFSLYDLSQKEGLLRLDLAADYFDRTVKTSSLVSPERWQRIFEDRFAKVRELIAALYRAEFWPGRERCADFCPYQDICRCVR